MSDEAVETLHSLGEMRVLHVEDDPDFADLTETYLLRADERFSVETALNAEAGLEQLTVTDFDCIVSDYDMPGQNGIEFLETVREDYPDLPFILFTGKGSEEVASEAISAGVSDYLQKGVGADRYSILANRIRNLVEQYTARAQLEVRVDQQQRLADLGQRALAGLEDEALFERAVTMVAEALDSEYVKVLEYRPECDDLLLRAGVGWRPGLVGEAVVGTGDDSQAGHTLRSEQPVVVEDLQNEDRFSGPPLLVDHDVVSGLSVIIGSTDDPWGVLGIHSTEQTAFTREDINFVQNVANVLGNAIRREETETQLRETRAWYQRILEQLSDHVIIVDESATISYCSPAVERQLGFTPEEVVGTDAFEFVHPDDIPVVASAFTEALEEPGTEVRAEYRVKAKDGTYRWIEARGGNYLDDVIGGVCVAVRDITERKDDEQELERYQTICETIDDVAFVVANDWTIEFASSAILEYVDVPIEALEGSPVMALADEYLIDEDGATRFETALRQAFETPAVDSPERVELTLAFGENRFIFEYQFSPIVEDDSVDAVVVTMREITQRKAREERLERTTRRLEAIYENSPDMIDVLDPEGTILDVNQSFCEELGYEAADVIGRPIWEFDRLVDEDGVRALLSELERDERRRFDGMYERLDGSTIPVEVHLMRIDVDGDDRFLAISRDISAHKQYEEKITAIHDASEDIFQGDSDDEVLDNLIEALRNTLKMPINGVAIHDDTEDCLRTVAITGRAADLLNDYPTFRAGESLAWAAFEDGETRRYDDVSKVPGRANPDTLMRSEIIIPLGDHGVVLIGSTEVGSFDEVDVSLAETLATHAETALDRVGREQELRQQNEQLQSFARIVSHDLRNPLSVAVGRLELARDDCDSEHLDAIEDALARCRTLIDDLLKLAKEGNEVSQLETVELETLVENCWDGIQRAEATISIDIDRTVRADTNRLRQLLENLLRNAVEHGGDDVTVAVGGLPEGFYVEDDGPGIPDEAHETVFDVGYSTTEAGTGFGLNIVARIAEAHGWNLRLTRSSTGGARFEITGVEFET